MHERPVTTPVSAKAAPQAAGSKEEQNIKERPTTVKREQSQSARAKEPVTKQQEVRTQVARESSSPAATPKHSGTVTDMPRQTVKHQKQTKTVQKKTTNPSTMKKTTSRKAVRNEAKTLRCVRWDFYGDYLSAFVPVYRDRR